MELRTTVASNISVTVAASLAIEYWTIKIHPAIFVTIFYVCIVLSIYLESTAMQKLKW